ncbi:zinc finger MYM-type protein 1-like [Phyllobates terribilis]|uniref:zinc finger MYM-type protein 1-like n=1 Tax=Phyllobates terribilis TaxID=111132 RepID=UPI003CCB4599
MFLAERGLPFRGKDEIIGSSHNGNYLGFMEVMANVDEFLEEHIKQHANKGRGHTSYLSSTVCEELVQILGTNVLSLIVQELKKAKFYSHSVDSTPDVSNCDQLTFIVRYALPTGPVERFLQFIPVIGHTGKQIAELIVDMLSKNGINIQDCRGQSYDNAANMSGKYNGVQAHVRNVCPYATYIPCAAHSLNLVGKNSAESIPEIYRFFNTLEQLYVFFSSSTGRWRVLVEKLKPLGLPVVKQLPTTRWSARYEAVLALYKGYEPIFNLLDCMATDPDFSSCKNEAEALGEKFSELDSTFILVVWHAILDRFHKTNLSLQEAGLHLNTVVALLQSLLDFVSSLKEEFDAYESEAVKLCGHNMYNSYVRRIRKRNCRFDDGNSEATLLSPRDKFKAEVFLSLVDNLMSGLSQRLGAYTDVCSKFGFLANLSKLSPLEIKKAGSNLVCSYPEDLMPGVTETELVQFSKFLSTSFIREKTIKNDLTELNLFLFLHEHNLTQTFCNTEIILRIYLSMMVSNCAGERSFSKLKRIKNELRSKMGQEQLNHLSLLSIECKLLKTLDLSQIIDEYSAKKCRKKKMLI